MKQEITGYFTAIYTYLWQPVLELFQ